MIKPHQTKRFSCKNAQLISLLLGTFWIVQSCANIGMPSGGPKDSNPPKVIKAEPANFSVNFNSSVIEIQFDEYIQTKNLKQQLVISPPSSNQPEIKVKGKKILIELSDTLLANTTYSINFGNAIVDNNEGNILQDLQYVFSTGPILDSLQVAGQVKDAFSGKAIDAAVVMLYKNLADSVPLRQIPYYVGRTNSKGEFRIRNISDTTYQLVALNDVNANYLYDSPDELIAFSDSLIRPSAYTIEKTDTLSRKSDEKTDTLTLDSIVIQSVTHFLPDSLSLYLFKEVPKQRKLVLKNRASAYRLEFAFSLPHPEEIRLNIVDQSLTTENSLQYYSPNRDTLSVWLLDSALFSQDSLEILLHYTKTDSLFQLVQQTDTLLLSYRPSTTPTDQKLNVKSSLKKQGTLEINDMAYFIFDQPLADIKLENLHFFVKSDTIFIPADFELKQDSLNPLKYDLRMDTEAAKSYRFTAEPGAFTSFSGLQNDSLIYQFDYRKQDAYGKLILKLDKGDENWVLDLITEKGILVRSAWIRNQKTWEFDNLLPEKYLLRVTVDENSNGKWDTGILSERVQPEKTHYPLGVIQIRANWDLEMEIKIQAKD
jgi:hypothetical protein